MSNRDRIIWQPTHLSQGHHDFEILLDRGFVGEMLKIKLGENQRRMNLLGERTAKYFKYKSSSPYIFEGNTAFVRQINLDAGRGSWLELEGQFGAIPDLSKKEPLKYTTHNMDSTSDTLALLALFEAWIYYSNTLKEISVR